MVMSGILPGSRVSVGIPAVAGFRDLVGFTSGAWYYQFDTRSYQMDAMLRCQLACC